METLEPKIYKHTQSVCVCVWERERERKRERGADLIVSVVLLVVVFHLKQIQYPKQQQTTRKMGNIRYAFKAQPDAFCAKRRKADDF